MYLSLETISTLKNFAGINQSILIKAGKKLRTMSVMKNILAEADISEEFERDVAIYDLNQFLNCLSLIPGAQVNLDESSIVITNDKNSIEYRYADPSVIVSPPDKELKLPSDDVCVVLSDDDISSAKKAAAVLGIEDVSIVGDGTVISLEVRDKKNSGSNSFRVVVGETENVFRFNMKVSNLKMESGDYDVVISAQNMGRFSNHSRPVVYYIAMEPDSTFSA